FQVRAYFHFVAPYSESMRDKANNSTFHVDYSAPKRHGCISKERCVGLSDIRKACAANASPAATTPVLLANPLTTRCVASTTIGAVIAYISLPLTIARRSALPLRAIASITKIWDERPLLSAAVGAGVLGSRISVIGARLI